MRMEPIAKLAAVGVGLVMLWSGASKIGQPDVFVQAVMGYDLLDARPSTAIGVALPWLEVLAGVCAVSGFWRSGGLLAVTMMMAIAGIAQGAVLGRGLEVGCGCFGASTTPVSGMTLARAALIGLVAAGAWAVLSGKPTAEPASGCAE